MAAYDSIVNVDEWISDHYLTNDETRGESFAKRAAAAVKEWKDQDKTAAPRSPWARLSARRIRSRVRRCARGCRTPSSWCRATAHRAAARETLRELLTQTDAAR